MTTLARGLALLFGATSVPLAAAQPRIPVPRPPNLGGCAPAVQTWWQGLGDGGQIVCAADPTRPAVLLIHGLHRDGRTWTAPSYVEYSYDYRNTPAPKTVSGPNAGIYKVGKSDWLYGDRISDENSPEHMMHSKLQVLLPANSITAGQPGSRDGAANSSY